MRMLRNSTTALIKHERIHTTVPRARAISRIADRLVTIAKKDNAVSRTRVGKFLYEKEMVWKLFDVIAPKYEFRPGGYTRVIKTERRMKDYAPMAYVEFVDRAGELRKPKPVNEKTLEHKANIWAEVRSFYKRQEQERVEKAKTWKSVVVPDPYREHAT